MQRLNSTDTVSRNRLNALAESRSAPDGESAARLLKYYRQQFILSGYCASVPLNRVKAKGFYEEHKSTFDRLTCFFKAHNLDVGRYIRYFAENLDKWEIDIDKELFSKYSLERYHEWLHGIDKRQRIYEWFMKSAKNLAMLCVEGEYISPKDCFIDALKEKKLSQLVVSGKISAYFLAAIPGFRNVIPKLDSFAKQDLAELYDRFDMYSTDVNEAILAARNRRANPFKVAAEELAKIRAERKNENRGRPPADLFDEKL